MESENNESCKAAPEAGNAPSSLKIKMNDFTFTYTASLLTAIHISFLKTVTDSITTFWCFTEKERYGERQLYTASYMKKPYP